MMAVKRKITSYLESWKNSPNRKPLIVQGARQVGKTWSVLEFGREHYDNVAYFNFETNPRLAATFDEDISPAALLPVLSKALLPGAQIALLAYAACLISVQALQTSLTDSFCLPYIEVYKIPFSAVRMWGSVGYVFTSAADAISLDGYVVNKVGTFQIAIVAKYMGVPYFVTGAPDPGHPTVDTVTIEMRDP